MATPEPLAVGKCFAAVMPEKWTKSMPASLAISANRNGLGSVCSDSTSGPVYVVDRRSPTILGSAAEGAAPNSGPLSRPRGAG